MKGYKNHIQLQKGMSLNQFLELYGTEKKCIEVIENIKWPNGYECGGCDSGEYYLYRNNGLRVYQCKKCGKQATLLAGTIFEQTKLPLRTWFLAIYFITQSKNGISTLELRRVIGVSYNAAWRIRHKLQQVMLERDADLKLTKRVEIDDSYLGGTKEGKAGRGSENKIPFIAAVETDKVGNPLQVIFSTVKSFTKEEIEDWAKKHLEDSVKLISDGYKCFGSFTELGLLHFPEVVGADRKSVKLDCFKWVNTILGNVKSAFSGTFHSFKFGKYAQRYLSEMQYRFNRRFDLKSLIIRLAVACTQTGARPASFLRFSEA